MRVHVQTRCRIGDADQIQQVNRSLTAGAFVTPLMHLNRFHNLETNGVTRVETGHRVLEDHRDFGTDQVAALFFRNTLQILTVKFQLFCHHATGIINQPHNRQRTNRFARTRLANNANHFALFHAVADAVYGAEWCAFITEMHR